VFGQPEGSLGIHRDDFVDAVTEYETAVEHRYMGFLDGHEFAVQINDVRHGGSVGVISGSKCKSQAAYLNSSRSESQVRPKIPATGTASSATTGRSR